MGCSCTHLSVASDGNADRKGDLGGLLFTFTGWVAVAINTKTDGLLYR